MTDRDREHLKLLSIFYYVLGGLSALGALVPIIHLVIGIGLLTAALDGSHGGPPAFFGAFFIIIALFVMLTSAVTAVLEFLEGWFLSQHRHHTFCVVVAAISCIGVPLGTILGVFTLIVLMRPSVKGGFGAAPAVGPVERPC
jgi:hypothetical protein